MVEERALKQTVVAAAQAAVHQIALPEDPSHPRDKVTQAATALVILPAAAEVLMRQEQPVLIFRAVTAVPVLHHLIRDPQLLMPAAAEVVQGLAVLVVTAVPAVEVQDLLVTQARPMAQLIPEAVPEVEMPVEYQVKRAARVL
jgi:hypothetical protein